jgi:hypothetical protein
VKPKRKMIIWKCKYENRKRMICLRLMNERCINKREEQRIKNGEKEEIMIMTVNFCVLFHVVLYLKKCRKPEEK